MVRKSGTFLRCMYIVPCTSYQPFKSQPHKMIKHTQKIRRLLPTNCLSVFDHFVRLALKGLGTKSSVTQSISLFSKLLIFCIAQRFVIHDIHKLILLSMASVIVILGIYKGLVKVSYFTPLSKFRGLYLRDSPPQQMQYIQRSSEK